MKNIFFTILFLINFLIAEITSEPEKAGLSLQRLQRLNEIMHQLVDNGEIAGIQTAIIRNGYIGHFNTYGNADLENKIPLRDDSIFRIYSMTKPIVSVGLMMLYEEGMFLLDDPVHKYIPEFKNIKFYKPLFPKLKLWPLNKIKYIGKTKKSVLIIDLLRHTSGLGYGWGPGTYIDRKYNKKKILMRKNSKDFIEKLTEIPLYHEPGERWRYSVSTDVCGYLIEVLSGQSLDKFLSDRIFKPLNMVDTHFQLPESKIDRFTSNYINNLPKGLRKIAKALGKSFNPDGSLMIVDRMDSSEFTRNVTFFSGGGGLVSTTTDYLQFCKMFLNKGELDGIRILSPKIVGLMTEDHLKYMERKKGLLGLPNNGTSFGLGFSVVKDIAAKEIVGSVGSHGWGGMAGTSFIIDPKENMIFIMMIQLIDFNDLEISKRFQTMVYQAIIN